MAASRGTRSPVRSRLPLSRRPADRASGRPRPHRSHPLDRGFEFVGAGVCRAKTETRSALTYLEEPSPKGTEMSAIDEFLKNNEAFAEGFDKGDLPLPPAQKVAIVACM